jgi:hypothetical protein
MKVGSKKVYLNLHIIINTVLGTGLQKGIFLDLLPIGETLPMGMTLERDWLPHRDMYINEREVSKIEFLTPFQYPG